MDVSRNLIEQIPTVSESGLQQALGEICRIGPRWHGTPEAEQAIVSIERMLKSSCDEVKLEDFPYIHYTAVTAELELTKPLSKTVACNGIQYSWNGAAKGTIVYAAEGRGQDFELLDEQGRDIQNCLVLVRTNRPYMVGKIARDRGAAGLIVISDSPFGSIRQMTSQMGCETPEDLDNFGLEIPGVIISREDGERMLSLLSSGNVQAKIRHESIRERKTSINVIGYRWGRKEPDKQVIIGAHYDTQYGIEGAWDNASGCAALVEIAGSCREIKSQRTMVFCGFGGEEIGLFGSTHFVQNRMDQIGDICSYVNLDSTSGDVPYTHELLTTQGMSDLAVALINDHSDWKITFNREFTPLDHEQDSAEFVKHGVNAFWAHEEGNAFFHTIYDTISTISIPKLARATRVALLPFFYLSQTEVLPF